MTNLRIVASLALTAVVALSGSPASAAVDNSYVPAAGGNWSTPGNWSLGHTPTSANNALIKVSGNAHKAVYFDVGSAGIVNLVIDGSAAGYYGALWHLQGSLMAENIYLGQLGEAWHWMEADAFLWSTGNLYVGYSGSGEGHFYLNVQDYGVLVNGESYVGYSGAGDFDHYDGYHACSHLFVGQNAPGTYWLRGSEATSTLNPEYYVVVGNGDVGLFEQTGGTVVNDSSFFLSLGLNPGGDGTYLMKGGTLNTHHMSIAYAGDGYFTQSGGTVNTETNVNIGVYEPQPHRAWYKLNEADGTAELNIGGDLNVGEFGLAKYEQTGGTATIAGDLNIYQDDPNSGDYSYVYMGTSAGTLEINGAAHNNSGYFDQDGGVFTTPSFTNDSPRGFNLDNNADFRATNVTHNAGTLYMWRNAIVRGELAIPPSTYFMCNFTNNSNIQMGNASFNGGTFVGHMTNNGSFNYTQGDFSASTLTNYGTVNLNGDFECNRLVNNANITVPTDRWITATGTGYANAFENNSNLTMRASSHIDVGSSSKLVNNGAMYAGGANNQYAHIYGDVQNNNYLLPCDSSQPAGYLYIDGDFAASSGAELRIRLQGDDPNDYDRLAIQGNATLAGELDVRLTNGYTPSLGATFFPVSWTAHTGQFSPVSLPALAAGLEWDVSYGTHNLRLKVVESQPCPGDLNGDGVVDLSDLATLLAHYGMPDGAAYEDGDLDGDGDVDLSDLATLLAVYGQPC